MDFTDVLTPQCHIVTTNHMKICIRNKPYKFELFTIKSHHSYPSVHIQSLVTHLCLSHTVPYLSISIHKRRLPLQSHFLLRVSMAIDAQHRLKARNCCHLLGAAGYVAGLTSDIACNLCCFIRCNLPKHHFTCKRL